jgi:hypothetical protein
MSAIERERPLVDHPRCPYCHEFVRPGDDEAKQSCGSCMAWHHAECWGEHGGCAACNRRDTGSARDTEARRGVATQDAQKGEVSPPRARRASATAGMALLVALAMLLLLVALRRPAPHLEHLPQHLEAGDNSWRDGLANARNEVERTHWARLGAESGDPGAMNQYGYRLSVGLGCEQDGAAAAEWGLKAAKLGHAEAMFGLGQLFEAGNGVPQDLGEAVYWYRQAVQAGDTLAGPRLDALLIQHPHLR